MSLKSCNRRYVLGFEAGRLVEAQAAVGEDADAPPWSRPWRPTSR